MCFMCFEHKNNAHITFDFVESFHAFTVQNKSSYVFLIKVEKTLQCWGVVSTSIVFSFSPPSKRNCIRVVANVKTANILIS